MRRWGSVKNECKAFSQTWFIWERSDSWTSSYSLDCWGPLPWKTTNYSEKQKRRKGTEVSSHSHFYSYWCLHKLLSFSYQCAEHHCFFGLAYCSSLYRRDNHLYIRFFVIENQQQPLTKWLGASYTMAYHSSLCIWVARCSQCDLSSA